MSINNVTIRNNEFYNNTAGFEDTGGIICDVTDSCDNINIINNSWFNWGPSGAAILLKGTFTNTRILNNSMDADGESNTTGIEAQDNFSSGVLDYNNTYDCTVNFNITGSVSAGLNNIDVDPLFVSATDLRLLINSPCVDTGVGNGTYSQVPTDDHRGQSRPVDIADVDNTDDATDMGAFESVQGELDRVFFVNAGGSNMTPFDTEAKGATNIKGLLDDITQLDGDIIEVTDDAEIDDSGAIIPITKDLIIRSYSGNTNKPIIKTHNNGAGFVINGINNSVSFNKLKIVKEGPGASSYFISLYGSFDSPSIIECEFYPINPSAHSIIAIFSEEAIFNNEFVIEKNKFYNVNTIFLAYGDSA